jgi:hypothetical protein
MFEAVPQTAAEIERPAADPMILEPIAPLALCRFVGHFAVRVLAGVLARTRQFGHDRNLGR